MAVDRDTNGQFKKGWNGGPGRPRLDAEQKYLRTLHRSLLQRDVREIIKKLIVKAKAGNIQAAKLLLEYAVGKPMQYVSADIKSTNEVVVNVICHEGNVQHQSPTDAPEASGDQT